MHAIQTISDDNPQIYGAPKIANEMQKKGEKISQRTVGVYMREMGIKACYIKPYVKTTFDSDFSTKLHNILKRDCSPSKPNEAWCTDITSIFTLEGFVYLTSVMDLYSRKIIAGRICIPYKCNGSIFKKNNCMDIIKNIGSGRSIEMYRDG